MGKPFAPKRSTARMDPAAAGRQGRAVSLAFAAFGDSNAVMRFLNSPHPELGERPIDLAVGSASGLALVEQAIASRPPTAPLDPSENPDRGLAG